MNKIFNKLLLAAALITFSASAANDNYDQLILNAMPGKYEVNDARGIDPNVLGAIDSNVLMDNVCDILEKDGSAICTDVLVLMRNINDLKNTLNEGVSDEEKVNLYNNVAKKANKFQKDLIAIRDAAHKKIQVLKQKWGKTGTTKKEIKVAADEAMKIIFFKYMYDDIIPSIQAGLEQSLNKINTISVESDGLYIVVETTGSEEVSEPELTPEEIAKMFGTSRTFGEDGSEINYEEVISKMDRPLDKKETRHYETKPQSSGLFGTVLNGILSLFGGNATTSIGNFQNLQIN